MKMPQIKKAPSTLIIYSSGSHRGSKFVSGIARCPENNKFGFSIDFEAEKYYLGAMN